LTFQVLSVQATVNLDFSIAPPMGVVERVVSKARIEA